MRDIQSIGKSPRVRSRLDSPERDRRRSVVDPILPKRPCERSSPLRSDREHQLTPRLRPGRLMEALLALDDREPAPKATSNFTPAPATQSPGPDWPPDQWD